MWKGTWGSHLKDEPRDGEKQALPGTEQGTCNAHTRSHKVMFDMWPVHHYGIVITTDALQQPDAC